MMIVSGELVPGDYCAKRNMLASSKSPYLRMHACDPVNWVPWEFVEGNLGRLGKPLLISIGYYSCKWCHVMHRESFMNPEVAEWINRVFIPVKVDREERPDVDEYYMIYCASTRGSCGWPLTVVADDEGRPFFVATYLRPEDIVELARVVEEVVREEEHLSIAKESQELMNALMNPSPGKDLPKNALGLVADAASQAFDEVYGGFGSGPKFPQAPIILALLAHYLRKGSQLSLAMTSITLHRIASGGIHDWVDGGFHRYAIDREWRTPHFEKMLYDQAVLARVYGESIKLLHDPVFSAVSSGIVRLLREKFLIKGGLASSLSAESCGEEGTYYSFTLSEVRDALGDLYEDASRVFEFKEEGNYVDELSGAASGRNLLFIGSPIPEVAAREGLGVDEVLNIIRAVSARLAVIRRGRCPPERDEKVITSWNGLAIWGISSLVSAGIDQALNLAMETYSRLKKSVIDGDRVWHEWVDGEARVRGMLADYAHLSLGLLSLHFVTGDEEALELSYTIAARIPKEFQSGDGFLKIRPGGPLEMYEGPYPSGYSAAVEVMERLGRILGDEALKQAARRAIKAISPSFENSPLRYPYLGVSADLVVKGTIDVVVSGGDEVADVMIKIATLPHHPINVVANRPGGYLSRTTTYARTMTPIGNKPTIYVCEEGTCLLPTNDVDKVLRYIKDRMYRGR